MVTVATEGGSEAAGGEVLGETVAVATGTEVVEDMETEEDTNEPSAKLLITEESTCRLNHHSTLPAFSFYYF